ncbi:hypothetical protein ACH3XW_3465 [Acanthocheilonema viteae]
MVSLEETNEMQKQLPTTTMYNVEEAGNANIEDAVIMQGKVIRESELPMQGESSTATTENKSGNRVEIVRNRMNEEFGGLVTVRNGSVQSKRKPKFVRHIIQGNIEQSGSETGQVHFDGSNEEPIDLSNRNEQEQALGRQSDKAISNGQHREERSDKRNDEKVEIPENAPSSAKRNCIESELPNTNQRYGNRTFSTFTPAEQEELRRKASKIYEGATFQSFDEFEEYLEAYKIVWNYPYRRASSEHLRDGEGRIINRFKYKYVVFHCAHYGLPRKRGVGKRPNQSYLPLGCQARFRLNSDTTNGCLRISSFHKEHKNHDSTEEDYLRVINKKRRYLTKETTPTYDNNEETMLNVNEHTNVRDIAENIFAPVLSSPGNFTLPRSFQENFAFVPIIHSTMMEHGMQQMIQQNTDFILQQLFAIWLSYRLHRIEYLIMNAYIINCGRYLPLEVYLPFICGIYGADYHLSEWSNAQLRNVMALLQQPPEMLLQGLLPSDISINEVKQVRPSGIQRAITAIREEKLKRGKVLTMFCG